jgi:photosynthetic reaction center cytochrome c subunit
MSANVMKRFTLLGIATLATLTLLAGCERPPIQPVQNGYRGTGMEQVYNPRSVAKDAALNTAPVALPAAPAEGPKAKDTYQNVKVLGDLSVGEFTRTMTAITQWVAPKEGCAYCHQGANFADDTLYTKVVARRMIQMTQHINGDWKAHVGSTGVTCYTCHRGNNVPNNLWFAQGPTKSAKLFLGNDYGQNHPAKAVGMTSLPYDPYMPYLKGDTGIRHASTTALPTGNKDSIKQAEQTYGLMMHMSQSLGVNCTYCHNTRNFSSWAESTPQRVTAWQGIRMARDLNNAYLDPLQAAYPSKRLGVTGDAPKLNCATCHQGAYKPLNGANMLSAHPELSGVKIAVAEAPKAGAPVGEIPAPPGYLKNAVVFFATGKSDINGDGGKTMEWVIDALKANPSATATISGYHSASGTLAQNQELSKQRAFAVRDSLKAAGVDAARVILQKPQQTEANLSGEDPQARRVEIALK